MVNQTVRAVQTEPVALKRPSFATRDLERCGSWGLVWMALALSSLSGCVAAMRPDRSAVPNPALADLERQRTVEEAMAQVNQNARRLVSLRARPSIAVQTADQRHRVSGVLSFQKPRDFKLALKSTVSPEADIGSNTEGFWFWMRNRGNGPREAYVCDYDATGESPVQATFQPDWIVEALGLRPFERSELANAQIEEGTGSEAGAWVITQRRVNSLGETTLKRTIIDRSTGLIREHQLMADDGQTLLARAVVQDYQDVPVPATPEQPRPAPIKLPYKFRLDWVPEQLSLEITLNSPEVNQPIPAVVFQVPSFKGYAKVNLRDAMGLTRRLGSETRQSTPLVSPPTASLVDQGVVALAASREPLDDQPPTRADFDPNTGRHATNPSADSLTGIETETNGSAIPTNPNAELNDRHLRRAFGGNKVVNPDTRAADRLIDQVIDARYPRAPGAQSEFSVPPTSSWFRRP